MVGNRDGMGRPWAAKMAGNGGFSWAS